MKKKRDGAFEKGYDFSKAVIGKYAAKYAEGTNIFRLPPETAKKVHLLSRKQRKSPESVLNDLVKRSLRDVA
ncbi:MAG: hypothetical protein HY961_14265 [Ignavibacteriae bacterium]|nr:hypothetical protein [Ignavibacteriota bacterium]